MFSISVTHAQNTDLEESYAASARQRKELSATYGITEEQAQLVQKFSYSRTKQIDSLANLKLPIVEFRKKRDLITDEYYNQIFLILTPEQRKLFDPEAFKAARTKEVQVLKLPAKEALAMGRLKAEYSKAINNLNSRQLPGAEHKVARAELDRKYRQDLRVLLGNDKFAEWQHFKDTELERRFKQTFGFTDEEYRQFIEIENHQAVEILKIKNSGLSYEERTQRIASAKEYKIECLRSILPESTFNKWYEYYLRKESQRK